MSEIKNDADLTQTTQNAEEVKNQIDNVTNEGELEEGFMNFEDIDILSEARPRLNPKDNNIFRFVLEEVKIIYETTPLVNDKNETSTYQYAGLKRPVLVFKYLQTNSPDDVKRYLPIRYTAVATITKNKQPVSISKAQSTVLGMYKHIAHKYTVYSAIPGFKKIEEVIKPKLNPTIDDLNIRIEQYNTWFEEMLKLFTTVFKQGTEEPIWKGMEVWYKLLPNEARTFLTEPQYVNDGYLELYRKDAVCGLTFKPNERLDLTSDIVKNTNKDSNSQLNEINEKLNGQVGTEFNPYAQY